MFSNRAPPFRHTPYHRSGTRYFTNLNLSLAGLRSGSLFALDLGGAHLNLDIPPAYHLKKHPHPVPT